MNRTPSARPELLGRRARGLTGPATARAAGNGYITSDLRGGARPAAYPGADSGALAQSNTITARATGVITPTTPDLRGPDQSRAAYGGGWADGLMTLRERAVMAMRGMSRLSARDSISGVPNPQHDGPAMPAYLMDSRTLSWQIGTDHTAFEDNGGPFARTMTMHVDSGHAAQNKAPAGMLDYPGGLPYPLGNQGDPWTTVHGGTPHLVREYGARGPSGLAGAPAPKRFALPGDGSGARVGTLIAEGDDTDGPQKIKGGVPHGRHSHTVNSSRWTGARLGSIPLQKPPRVDRPLSSKIAGQSMSQLYPPEGSSAPSRIPRMPAGQRGRQAGVTTRFLGR